MMIRVSGAQSPIDIVPQVTLRSAEPSLTKPCPFIRRRRASSDLTNNHEERIGRVDSNDLGGGDWYVSSRGEPAWERKDDSDR
jgi:hypothetical protein